MINIVTVRSLPIRKGSGRGHKSDWIKFASKYSPKVAEELKRLRKLHPRYNKSAVIDAALTEWIANFAFENDYTCLEFIPCLKIVPKTKQLFYFGEVVLSAKFTPTRHGPGLLAPCKQFTIAKLML